MNVFKAPFPILLLLLQDEAKVGVHQMTFTWESVNPREVVVEVMPFPKKKMAVSPKQSWWKSMKIEVPQHPPGMTITKINSNMSLTVVTLIVKPIWVCNPFFFFWNVLLNVVLVCLCYPQFSNNFGISFKKEACITIPSTYLFSSVFLITSLLIALIGKAA